mmetsp:Transcript_25593/g.54046  ORF Transcript_25593/g.54046 Transcript_25593/m.54046 type:complete len:340 (-) Transcript_25593:195-1214(-)
MIIHIVLGLVHQRLHLPFSHSLQMIKGRFQEIHLITTAKHQLIIANVCHVRNEKLHTRIKHLGQLLKVSKIILHQNPLRTEQQLHGTKHIQSLGHRHAHHCLTQIQQHQIKGTKILARQQRQTLCPITKPPLHLRIIKMRLGLKVLERIPRHLLIQLQSQHQFEVLVLENFVKEHGIPASHEYHAVHPRHVPVVQIRGAQMHKRLVIVWPVRRTLLQRAIQSQTLIFQLEIFLKHDLLIQRILHGHLLEVLVILIVRIIARTPLEFEFAKVIGEVLNVVPDLTRSVGIAAEASLHVLVVVGGIVGGVPPAVDVDLFGGLGTIEVGEDGIVGGMDGGGGG